MSPTVLQKLRRQTLAAWLLTLGFLLDSAVPMLASLAAQAQHKAVGEICQVHGMPAADTQSLPTQDDGSAQPDKRCPLAALAMHRAAGTGPRCRSQARPPAA